MRRDSEESVIEPGRYRLLRSDGSVDGILRYSGSGELCILSNNPLKVYTLGAPELVSGWEELGGNALKTYLCLRELAGEACDVQVDQKTLAKRLHKSEMTIERGLRELEEKGLIGTERQGGKPNLYRLLAGGIPPEVQSNSSVGFQGPLQGLSGEPPGETLGERIKRKREELGLSRRALSEKIGSSYFTVYRYEQSGHLPAAGFLPRLMEALEDSGLLDVYWVEASKQAKKFYKKPLKSG